MRILLPSSNAESMLFISIAYVSVLQFLCPTVSSLIMNPRHLPFFKGSASRYMSRTFPTGTASTRKIYTKLKHDNNDDGDDFASFNNYQEEDNGRELAKEFYKELQYRESQPPTTNSFVSNLEETARDSTNNNDDDNATTIRIQANRNIIDSSKSERRRTFTNQPTTSSSPLFDLLAFFSISPPSRPAQSAGLFSGSGTTVYSSGRSIRAEIEILESTIKNSEDNATGTEWNGIYISSPEQLEEVLRSVLISLIVLSAAYVAVESGGMNALSLDHVMTLMSDVTDGMSSMMVSVGEGEVFVGEEAAWLMKESSELAASVAAEALKSVEALVLI